MVLSEADRKLFEINPLDEKLPIFVCSKDLAQGSLRKFFHKNNSSLSTISSQSEIEKKTNSIYQKLQFLKPYQKLKESLNSIIEPLNISFKAFGVSVSRAAANRKPSDNLTDKKEIIYIKQDGLIPEQVNKLASLYQELPCSERPFLFFEPSSSNLGFINHFLSLNGNIEIKPLGQVRTWSNIPSKKNNFKIKTVNEFLQCFLSNSYTSCAKAEAIFVKPRDFKKLSPEMLLTRLTLESLIIKSFDATGNKFKAVPIAHRLFNKVDLAKDILKNEKQMQFLMCKRRLNSIFSNESVYGKMVSN